MAHSEESTAQLNIPDEFQSIFETALGYKSVVQSADLIHEKTTGCNFAILVLLSLQGITTEATITSVSFYIVLYSEKSQHRGREAHSQMTPNTSPYGWLNYIPWYIGTYWLHGIMDKYCMYVQERWQANTPEWKPTKWSSDDWPRIRRCCPACPWVPPPPSPHPPPPPGTCTVHSTVQYSVDLSRYSWTKMKS